VYALWPLPHTPNHAIQAEKLCQHGWDHPSLSAVLESTSAEPRSTGSSVQQPSSSIQHGVMEGDGLLRLRLAYLELCGKRAAYLKLAIAGKQWSHTISALLRSGDR
jgi:hypothetical protein